MHGLGVCCCAPTFPHAPNAQSDSVGQKLRRSASFLGAQLEDIFNLLLYCMFTPSHCFTIRNTALSIQLSTLLSVTYCAHGQLFLIHSQEWKTLTHSQ